MYKLLYSEQTLANQAPECIADFFIKKVLSVTITVNVYFVSTCMILLLILLVLFLQVNFCQ